MGITGKFAQFIAGGKYEDLPESAVAAAKRGMIDFLAVTIAGSQEDVAEKVMNYARKNGCIGEASVINGDFKTSAGMAALVNGTLAHALDYDDVIHVPPAWLGHPSVAILPAILAIAEAKELSGRDVILAYCLGIEVYVKTGLYCGDDPYRNGWHNTSYIGTMAAAAAASSLLKLNETQIRHALGIAASHACGIRQNFGTMTKPLHAGLAARNGVEAALLASEGFTANEDIYEAPMGFRNVFSASKCDTTKNIPYGNETISVEEFAEKLGNPWNIATPGMSFKLCPSCRATHFGMEAGVQFRETHTAGPEQIAEIECHVPNHMESVLIYHEPQKGLEGKFSLEYVLARTVLEGIPGIHDFTDERVGEPEIKALISKIKWVSFVPEADSFGIPEFIFRMTDGTEFSTSVEFPKGEPENPVDNETIVHKYMDCAGAVFEDGVKNQIRNQVLNLENLDSISELMSLLKKQ